jgi:transmembrane sensor
MVTVDGEAYFEVPKVAGAPFIVRSGAVATRVLGTSFLVRYRGDAGRVHIAVTDGKVTMAGLFAQRTLTAGDIGDATDSTVKVSTVKEMTPEVEWENGKIVFRDTPVPKVLAALTHWYGLQFKCADSAINKQSVTVLISPSSSSAALSKLEQVLDVSLTVVGDTVMLAPRAVPLRMRMPRMHSYDVWIPHSEVGR